MSDPTPPGGSSKEQSDCAVAELQDDVKEVSENEPDEEDSDTDYIVENIGKERNESDRAGLAQIRGQLEGKLSVVLKLQEHAKDMRDQAISSFCKESKRLKEPKHRIEKVLSELLSDYWRRHGKMIEQD